MLNKKLLSTIVAFSLLAFTSTYAEDTLQTKTKNTAEDIKADTSKGVRKARRKIRKATGTDTAGKDIKDFANDSKDDIKRGKNKTVNKLEETK